MDVRLFPVSQVQLTALPLDSWKERRARVERLVDEASLGEIRALGREYLAAIDAYESTAKTAGSGFVEIQNATLFATVGQKSE